MPKDPKWKKYLKNIYYNINHPAAFSSYTKLNRIIKNENKYKISGKKINQFLEEQDVHLLTKQTRKFKRLKTIFTRKNYLLDADCGYMPREYADKNGGLYMFLLVCDGLSRFIQCKLIKTASGEEVSKALSEILDFYEKKSNVTNLRSDLGSEFKSHLTRKMLNNRGINHIFAQSQHKANFAESAIKHLKRLIYSYMKAKLTEKWVDVFYKTVKTRNKSFNRSLGTNPLNAWNNLSNVKLWKYQFGMK